MYIYIYICIGIYVYIYIYICAARVCARVCVYVCMYVCVCVKWFLLNFISIFYLILKKGKDFWSFDMAHSFCTIHCGDQLPVTVKYRVFVPHKFCQYAMFFFNFRSNKHFYSPNVYNLFLFSFQSSLIFWSAGLCLILNEPT